ncbi:carboxymuconolactone decarboxylase family protein [Albidovulum sediminicola]|uniref:Carboxymuconolactone decarboxylase family protein n=1 Tax=Albidovulum sediminicola TaxID=2984331 RepID=A0ABT2Z4F1_9RHOB|nr:carboxymuconolactone decarboxylase family protein [Defluviimonas sp. WL0075]MCV2865900.1 carboxymuconolactone decarboxylase family protein [Defluviimonas sp. WL0075]
MADLHLPKPTRELVDRRHALAPGPEDAFRAFSKAVFAEGALDARTKQLIAVAVAHVTQCPWCIEGHVKAAQREGASGEQIMEAIWVAAEMRAGAAWAHALKAVELIPGTDKREA